MTATLGKIAADYSSTLNLKTAIGATSATLDSATDDDGVALPTGTYFLTLDRKSASKEYIKCTLTGTALTDIYHVSRQGTLTSGMNNTHRKSATVEITDFAIIKKMLDLLDGTTDFNASVPLGYDANPTLTTGSNEFATVKYADDLAIAGSPDATIATKGITTMSVAPASAATPIAVGDNDPRVPTQDENNALVGTSGTPSSSNKYVTNDDTTGTGSVVRASGIADLMVSTKLFGTGADGAVAFDGSTTILGLVPAGNIYTMTRDIHCTNITINVGVTVKPAGYRIYATGTLTNNGTISNNGGNGGNAVNSSASTPGTVGAAGTQATAGVTVFGTVQAGTAGGIGKTANGNGNSATSPTSITNCVCGAGGSGGAGGGVENGGGTGGSSTATTSGTNGVNDLITATTFYTIAGVIKAGTAGGGGGGGGNFIPGSIGTGCSGSGGGGGGAGGVVYVATKTLAGAGTISATGGNGGNGGNAFLGSATNVRLGGGGGGGGGAGGAVIVITQTSVNPNTISVTSGTAGTFGTGVKEGMSGSNADGAAGANGTTGQSVYFVI